MSFLKIGFRGSLPWPQSSAGSQVNCARSGSVADTATARQKAPARRDRRRHTVTRTRAILMAAFARADRGVHRSWRGGLCGVTRQSARRHGGIFTSAALITFGGAYAVLPYVTSGSRKYQWLTTAQMMDGLALGETTPGPLILILTFVGYLGGVKNAVASSPLASGLLAGTVVTFFTFLPSFMMIFAGAPFIESTRSSLKLQAPLTGITAAVVGVIGSSPCSSRSTRSGRRAFRDGAATSTGSLR